MILKKKLLLKKRKKHADKTTVSTESCSHSQSSPLSMSSPLLSPLSNVSSSTAAHARVNAAAAAVDDGTPSHSALNDLHRVLKLIQDERHLIAYKLYMHAKERTILRHTTVTNNNNNNTNMKSLSAMDTSLASARSLLNSKQHEFHTLERRFDIFNAAKVNTAHEADTIDNNSNNTNSSSNNNNDWILAQTLFGITTYYRHESIDNSLSIKIEGELSDTTIPLFEQIVVLREADLYSTWAPFMTKSSKLAQIGTLDVVAHYEVRVPLLGLMRDACFRAVGCDCMKETGQVLLVAVGLNDSEEHGVKSALNCGGSGERGGGPRGGGGRGRSGEEAIVSESKIDETSGSGEQRRQSYAEQLTSATTDSNLVTDTVASTFLARDEILETIAIPPIPTGLGHGRMTIRNFAASIDVLGPSSARTCLVVNIDPNLHFLPQSLIDFTMKKMAGVMILKLQQAAKRVVSDPIKNPHARRMREDVSFYRDWLLPRFQRHCDEMGWDMPPVRALEVSEEALRAGGVFESWRSELDSGGGGGGLSSSPSSTSLLNDDNTATECDDDEDENGGGTGSLLSSQSSKSSRSKKFAKLVKQLRYPETPEEKIAAARARAARRLKPQPFSDSKKRRLRELKGVKRKTEDRIRANDESSCDGEGSVSTFGTSVQTFQRWDEDSGLKRSLVVFASTFLLNVLLPYFSSDKFLSSLSSSFKTQITSVAKDSVLPLLFITLHAITLRSLLNFVLIFAFDSIDFGQRKLVQNMESVRKLYYGEVRKYSSITAAGVVAISCGVAFLRFFLDEVVLGMCSYFEKDWVTSFCDAASSKDVFSCAQWALTISTFITTRLGIFVLALLLMASLVLPKPERRVRQKSTPKKKAFRSPHSLAASSRASTLNQQVESEAEETESGSVVSISSTSIGRGRDIPDTIGGIMSPSQSLSICGTFSPVGSMSMDVIDEEDEDIH